MLQRDIRATLAAFVERGEAEIARVERATRRRTAGAHEPTLAGPRVREAQSPSSRSTIHPRTSGMVTPPGYLLASEACRKYDVSRRRLQAWVRVGRVKVIRGINSAGEPIYCYNDGDIAFARRDDPNATSTYAQPLSTS